MHYLIQTAAQLSPHLRALRSAKGLSQKQLGALLGIGQTRIARIERDPASISVAQLLKLLSALDSRMAIDDGARACAMVSPSPDSAAW
jgi:HTH-type transcriptional regulator/antitoxin HipB